MTSRVKKILSIVIISVIVAITVLTIVLAIVPKRLYNPVVSGYDRVAVYKDGRGVGYDLVENQMTDKQSAFKADLEKYLGDSFKDNLLSSIFQGTGRFENKVVSKDEGNVSTSIAKASGSVCLVFEYYEEQKLIFNGKEYKNPLRPVDQDETITFTKIYMPLSNDSDFQERVVYLTKGDNKSSYQIKFLAHQGDLYNFVQNLENDSF